MIASTNHRAGNAAKNGAAVVLDRTGFAVHQPRRANDSAAKGRADRLMSQAHSQDGDLAGKVFHQRNADARLLRRARAGRDHNPLRRQRFNILNCHLVVAANFHLRAQFSQHLH